MSTSVTYNGTTYSVPAEGDDGWGSSLSSYLIALATGSLQKSGGAFTLTADANFGATYGLKAAYLKSQATNTSSAGIIRLGNNESIGFRNAANSADLLLKANTSDVLEFNSQTVAILASSALTASRVLVSDVSGLVSASSITATVLSYLDATSSIQTQINARALDSDLYNHVHDISDAHAASAIGNTPSGNLSSTTVQNALNELQSDIDTRVVASSAAITSALTMDEVAAPSTPASGKFAIYPKSDGKLYTKNDAGTETEVGAGGSSGINYIDNPDAESDTTGYAAYADAAATSPVDGTGGSPTVTITRSTSSPLRGVGSFVITKDAANRQGEGVSYDFTIDAADKYKVLQGSFDYAIGSGTYADDDMSVWIYDVTNAKLIQPAPYLLKNHSLPSERMPFEFQCSDSTSYRLIVHVGSTSASAYTVKFDNVVVGPQAKLYGSAVTDWVSYTPTGSWTSNTTYTGFKRRVGDNQEYSIQIATSGAPTASPLTINLTETVDTSKIANLIATAQVLGSANFLDAGIALYNGVVAYNTSTSVILIPTATFSGSNPVGISSGFAASNTNPFVFGANDKIIANFSVPIQGWSSSQIMSSDANTNVIAFSGNGATSSAVGSNTDIKFATISTDKTGSYNASTGEWEVLTPGYYVVTAGARVTGSPSVGQYLDSIINVDGSPKREFLKYVENASVGGYSASVSYAADFTAGQKIKLVVDTNITTPTLTTGSTHTYMQIAKSSGPAQIMASESVSASYRISTDKTPSVSSPIDFDTKIFDSRNAVTTGSSWKFTAPTGGTYLIIITNATSTTGGTLDLYVNGAQDRGMMSMPDTSVRSSSAIVKLLAGGYIDIRCDTASKTFTGTKNNTIYITKVGNY